METEGGLSNYSDKYHQVQEDKLEIQIIMVWKTSKLFLAPIGYETGIK